MATAVVPKVVLTVNHASGAGYYAMAGQGFDPDFILTLPTGRMGVMEGASAATALFGPELRRPQGGGHPAGPGAEGAHRERPFGLRGAARRHLRRGPGFVDAVVLPEEVRDWLALLLRASSRNPGPHLGPFVLPAGLGELHG